MGNLGYTRLDVCNDDSWKYQIKCPMCNSECGRTSRDTVLLCNTAWTFAGERADGARREDAGFCGNFPYRMESAEHEDVRDAPQWRSLVLTARRADGGDRVAGSEQGEEDGVKQVGRNSAW